MFCLKWVWCYRTHTHPTRSYYKDTLPSPKWIRMKAWKLWTVTDAHWWIMNPAPWFFNSLCVIGIDSIRCTTGTQKLCHCEWVWSSWTGVTRTCVAPSQQLICNSRSWGVDGQPFTWNINLNQCGREKITAWLLLLQGFHQASPLKWIAWLPDFTHPALNRQSSKR